MNAGIASVGDQRTSQEQPTLHGRAERRERRLWGLAATAVVALGYFIVLMVNSRFFYQDDTDGGAVPIWIDVGLALRAGDLPILEPGQWMAGNYAVEGQSSLFNPVQALINVIAPSIDDLSLYAAAVKLIFAVVLATGVYRTALEYGASPPWAAAAGAAMPFTGFTLYYDSATWVTGLMGSAWVAQAWASSVRYSRGRSGPLPAAIFLYLALSVGYVHAAIMAGAVVATLMAAEALSRRWGCVVRLGLLGLSAGLVAAITFLPGLLSSDVTWRSGIYAQNDGFLSAAWSETLTMSLPSQLPAVAGFAGAVQRSPVTYVAWFVLPALAFVRWDRVARHAQRLAAPAILLVGSLLLTAGPSLLGPLRWPARLLPYVAMAVLVILAVLLSRYVVARVTLGRVALSAGLIGITVVRATSANPSLLLRHILAAGVVAALATVAVIVYARVGPTVAAALVMVSVLPVVALMVRWYPENSNVNQWDFPAVRSDALVAFPDRDGSTLQLGSYGEVPRVERTLDAAWSELVFGNYARFLQQNYVNAYTPVGFAAFSDRLCMDYAGSTCPEAYDRVFAIEESTGAPLADLMGLDRVVLQRAQFPDVPGGEAPEGWTVVDITEQVLVLERRSDRPNADSWASVTPGVSIEDVLSAGGEHDELLVSSADGGRVVFARLPWPGYEATINGRPVEVTVVDDLFVSVAVPPSSDDVVLRLEYQPPGYGLGVISAAAGVIVLGGLMLDRRRRNGTLDEPATDRPEAEARA